MLPCLSMVTIYTSYLQRAPIIDAISKLFTLSHPAWQFPHSTQDQIEAPAPTLLFFLNYQSLTLLKDL